MGVQVDALFDIDAHPVIVAIHDADTFQLGLVYDPEGGVAGFPWLRLTAAGDKWVDAPETGTDAAAVATRWLRDTLMSAVTVQVVLQGWSFSRRVAEVTVDGRDLAEWMVTENHARWSP